MSDTPLGRGYIELVGVDRGMIQSLRNVSVNAQNVDRNMRGAALSTARAEKELAQYAARAERTERRASFGGPRGGVGGIGGISVSASKAQTALRGVATAAATAESAAGGAGRAMTTLGMTIGSIPTPATMVAGALVAITGIALDKWADAGAKKADELAASMKRVAEVADTARAGTIAGLMSSTPGTAARDRTVAAISTSDAARKAIEGGVDDHQRQRLADKVREGRQSVEGFEASTVLEASKIERSLPGSSLEDREAALKKLIDLYGQLRDVAKLATDSTDAPGADYERFVATLVRSNAELQRFQSELAGVDGAKRDKAARERQDKAQEAFEADEARKLAERNARPFEPSDEDNARVANLLADMEAVKRNAEEVRERMERQREMEDKVAVAKLRAGGRDQEADRLERVQKFRDMRDRSMSAAESSGIDQLEAMENAKAAPRGGRTVGMVDALRSLQESVYSQGGSPDERVAKATEQGAKHGKETADHTKVAAEELKKISGKLDKGIGGTFQ